MTSRLHTFLGGRVMDDIGDEVLEADDHLGDGTAIFFAARCMEAGRRPGLRLQVHIEEVL